MSGAAGVGQAGSSVGALRGLIDGTQQNNELTKAYVGHGADTCADFMRTAFGEQPEISLSFSPSSGHDGQQMVRALSRREKRSAQVSCVLTLIASSVRHCFMFSSPLHTCTDGQL